MVPGTRVALRSYHRPHPGIFLEANTRTSLKNIKVHYAEGMGVVAQRCTDIHLNHVDVCLPKGKGRYFTTQADATHFVQCRGRIVEENSLYEGMMDDAINVHGVYLRVRERIDSRIHLPEGYHVEYGGQFESEQEASRTLMGASLLSVLLIFLLLYNQFRHAGQAAVILLNLPLALIGGVVAVALSGAVLSIPSIIGFISLFGIATRNGMLLVSRYNDLRDQGLSPLRSVIQGSTDRITPILMTALTSALALVPMVLNGDLPGNEIQSPMAKVILGGLFTSTLLNSLIIPIMYLILEKRKS